MTPTNFVRELASLRLPSVFNPYADRCETYDLHDAAKIRADNLSALIDAALALSTRTIWVGRDLGHRGGRRTGVPLTDEVHLPIAARLFGGLTLRKATRGPSMKEQTASVVWRALASLPSPPFLWNVFPLHPHDVSNQLSNRSHTRGEREATAQTLEALLKMMRPTHLVAIGRDAEQALQHLGIRTTTLRHPSYGGSKKFASGVQELRDPLR